MGVEGLKDVIRTVENGRKWVSITAKTKSGPTSLIQELEKALAKEGWKVSFKANWWGAVAYGVALLEIQGEKNKKALIVKWVLSNDDRIVKVEDKNEREAKTELYTIIDMVSDDLILDIALRNMMARY
ncbi:hypothetical protein PNA2_1347 [Pyrococcus sp. NA2]|uniref:hypothetical protein n=1 Tax=Pyrococcus sp. (strain NA2) TaxID=342949 RepID=UPI000209AE0A|nr:hypothetical protein [Pyrococcus sp. NA2]AEC52262.1 hypothetical protein PNA2_1347 [Pyrococcus sp. NA2]